MIRNGEFKCGFAFPGTYGHECGKPATLIGVLSSDRTRNGVYYAHRCANCTQFRGGDNSGISKWIPLDKSAHINVFC